MKRGAEPRAHHSVEDFRLAHIAGMTPRHQLKPRIPNLRRHPLRAGRRHEHVVRRRDQQSLGRDIAETILDVEPGERIDPSLDIGGALEMRDPEGLRPTLEEMERRYIVEILRATGDDKTQAANILGIDLSTLYRKLKRYEEM